MKKTKKERKIRCILVRPHQLPEELHIANTISSIEKQIGGSFTLMDIPELGNGIAVIIRKEADIFSPEKNRPLFDHDGRPYGCICGDFIVAGLSDGLFRSLSESEYVRVKRKYEQPYKIVIEKNNNNFVACIPEQPAGNEA